MINPVMVQVSPNKVNIRFGVRKILSAEEYFKPLAELQRLAFKRTIIFCQRQLDCGVLYHLFEKHLGKAISDPIGSPSSHPECSLVSVFTKGIEDLIKDSVLEQITIPPHASKLRLLICTIAFGMGVNCACVERVIHFGPPNDVETYIQQVGRAGRDNETSDCMLLLMKGQSRFCDTKMHAYYENERLYVEEIHFL